MNFRTIALVAVMSIASNGFAQGQGNTTGAKQLFVDTTTGVTLTGAPNRPVSPRPGGGTAPAPRPGTDVTGLMYYLEVVQPNGQALRVPASRTFRSGERIRFHVIGNVNGRLSILQSENGGNFLPLFPNAQLRGGDDRVESGKEIVIPMRFDNNPGNIRLLLMLMADNATPVSAPVAANARPTAPAPSSAPVPAQTPARSTTPASATTAAPTQQAANTAPRPAPDYDPKAPMAKPPKFNPAESDMRAQLNRQSGSKALQIEVDETSAQPATYVVVDARRENNYPAGTVAVEVKLTHQP